SLPMRVRISEQQTVAELLSAVRAQTLAVRVHDQSALVDIQGLSEMSRGSPLFETLLMYENRELNHTLRSLDPVWTDRKATLFEQPSPPLTIIVVDDDTFEIRVLFDRKRYRDAAAERIATYLTTALQELMLKSRVAEIDILPPEERTRILYEWNDSAHEY